MRTEMKFKILSIFLIIILTLNLVLFSYRKINTMTFWIVIIVIGLMSYKGIPYMKKRIKST